LPETFQTFIKTILDASTKCVLTREITVKSKGVKTETRDRVLYLYSGTYNGGFPAVRYAFKNFQSSWLGNAKLVQKKKNATNKKNLSMI